MMTATLSPDRTEAAVPRRRKADSPGEVPDAPARLEEDVVEKANFVARKRSKREGRRITISDYLTPMVRPQVEADYAAEIEAEHDELKRRGRPR